MSWLNTSRIKRLELELFNMSEQAKVYEEIEELREQLKIKQKETEYFEEIKRLNALKHSIYNVFSNEYGTFVTMHGSEVDYRGNPEQIKFEVLELKKDRVLAKEIAYLHANLLYQPIRSNQYLTTIYIENLVVRKASNFNKGFGSELLASLIDFVEKKLAFLGSVIIEGDLSEIDERTIDNLKRRNHLYEKFGFAVDQKNRTIRKRITGDSISDTD
ncbi:unnamed protein product [Fructobacillus fructosus]|nr:unnamed protein product [Fructobacillus fructosus]